MLFRSRRRAGGVSRVILLDEPGGVEQDKVVPRHAEYLVERAEVAHEAGTGGGGDGRGAAEASGGG